MIMTMLRSLKPGSHLKYGVRTSNAPVLSAYFSTRPPSLMSDVHGTTHGKKHWRNKPLFRRGGDKRFRNGAEAAEMLAEEAQRKDPHEQLFFTSVEGFVKSVIPVFDRFPKYAWVMKQLMEPERVLQFRVPWIDDTGNHRVNRGIRVQFSSSCGPYIGGLRFHENTGHSLVKTLAFDAVFRNAIVGDFGGAHGGSDFVPDDKSEGEVMRFCQSFMTELANYIGPSSDIPTSGVNVGPKEIGYMFGQYKRLRQLHPGGTEGILSGGQFWHPEMTGYGVVQFAKLVLEARGESFEGKKCLVSGSGTVALHVAEKLVSMGATVIGMSDHSGHVIEPEGFSKKNMEDLKKMKSDRTTLIGGYIMGSTSAVYHPADEKSLWDTPCDYAFPCSMENDITGTVAKKLVKNGCKGVFEGASVPCSDEAIDLFKENNVAFAPSKATNSASMALHGKNPNLTREELDAVIQDWAKTNYDIISKTAAEFNCTGDLHVGANITGFMSVAQAMFRQGAV